MLSRRLPAGSQLRLYVRAPESANSRRDNHTRMLSRRLPFDLFLSDHMQTTSSSKRSAPVRDRTTLQGASVLLSFQDAAGGILLSLPILRSRSNDSNRASNQCNQAKQASKVKQAKQSKQAEQASEASTQSKPSKASNASKASTASKQERQSNQAKQA